jgi:hypothetical protein
MSRLLTVIAFVLVKALARGQDSRAFLSGSGYSPTPFLSAVPGELLTLFVGGLDPELRCPFFTKSPPLPLEVNGLTVWITHTETGTGVETPPTEYPAAIHSLRQDGSITAITIQVPPEIQTRNLPTGLPAYPRLGPFNGSIRVMHGEAALVSAELMIWAQRIRVVKSCDFVFEKDPIGELYPGTCEPMIVRQDGSHTWGYVAPGETIKVLITGLGAQRQPGSPELLKSGWPNPDPPLASGISYNQQIGANLGPRQPWAFKTLSGPQPPRLSATGILLPNEYGLAAIEFVVPTLNTPPGGGDPECPSEIATWRSNLTLTIGSTTSYDVIPLCVGDAPSAPNSAKSKGRIR